MSDRSIVNLAHAQSFCDTRCKWEKPRKRQALAINKRYANRVARRMLSRDLATRASDAMADIARSKRAS